MALVTAENIIKDGRISETENGLEVVERYLVTGLSPTSRSPQWDALAATGIPAYGDPHPYIPNVSVRQRSPLPFMNSRTQVHVDIIYRNPSRDANSMNPNDPPRLEFHATTERRESMRDRDNYPVKVYYRTRKPIIGKYQSIVAKGLLTADWATKTYPGFLLSYFRRLNNAPWRSGAKYTWYFADLSIIKALYNPWWYVHCAFSYDEDTHVAIVPYIDPVSGIVPEDIVQPFDPYQLRPAGNSGWTSVIPAPEADFTAIPIPSVV